VGLLHYGKSAIKRVGRQAVPEEKESALVRVKRWFKGNF